MQDGEEIGPGQEPTTIPDSEEEIEEQEGDVEPHFEEVRSGESYNQEIG